MNADDPDVRIRGEADDDERRAILTALRQVEQAVQARQSYQRWRRQRLAAISVSASRGR